MSEQEQARDYAQAVGEIECVLHLCDMHVHGAEDMERLRTLLNGVFNIPIRVSESRKIPEWEGEEF